MGYTHKRQLKVLTIRKTVKMTGMATKWVALTDQSESLMPPSLNNRFEAFVQALPADDIEQAYEFKLIKK